MMVEKCIGMKCDEPFPLAADATYIFENGYRAKLKVTTPTPGYFYVLNEPLDKPNGSPGYIILYPSPEERKNSNSTQIEVPKDDWFQFDKKKGTEKLWVMWSERPVEQLDSVIKLVNAKDQGRVKDAAQNAAIDELLKRNTVPGSGIEKDETNKQTNVKARSAYIVHAISLEHR
jgi:hypothetical protein